MAFQPKLSGYYVLQSYAVWLWKFENVKPTLQNYVAKKI